MKNNNVCEKAEQDITRTRRTRTRKKTINQQNYPQQNSEKTNLKQLTRQVEISSVPSFFKP